MIEAILIIGGAVIGVALTLLWLSWWFTKDGGIWR